MDYQKAARQILEYIGGESNVAQVGHCMTRLRFNLKDESKAQTDKLKDMEEVIDVVQRGGQYQVIIGTEVKNVYQQLEQLGDFKQEEQDKQPKKEEKKKGLSAVLDVLSGIFTPLLPVLIASGMLKAVLTLLTAFNLLNTDGNFCYFLTFVADAGMYYLPVFAAYTAAKKFGANPFLSMFLVACLLHPDFLELCASGEPIKLLGLLVKNVTYSSNTIPAILTVWMLSYIEKFFYKYVPNMVKVIFAPTLTILVAFPLMFIIVAPLGGILGDGLSVVFSFLNEVVPWLMPALWGAFCSILVMCGMHYSLASVFGIMYSMLGYETAMMPGMFVANIAHGGATAAVAVKSKDPKMKQLAGSTAFTAALGITEPALYGVTLKLKTPLLAAMIGGGIGGLFCGLTQVKAYAMSSPGLASIVMFIGGGSMTNFYNACIAAVIAFISAFIIAMILKFKEQIPEGSKEKSETTETADFHSTETKEALEPGVIYSPLSGKVIPLEEVPDDAFAGKVIGDGIAIEPSEGKVFAPFDGTVETLFDTKHAIGLSGKDGLEVLIHVGIDTVSLNENGFTAYIKDGDSVRKGDLLLEFDMEYIKSQGLHTVTPVLIANMETVASITPENENTVQSGQALMRVEKKED